MKRAIEFKILILILVLASAGWRINDRAYAEETVQEAVEREMPLLKGDQWVTMDENAKVAFIWGAGHVVTIEEVLMQKYPDLKRDSFVTKAVEATHNSPVSMIQIAAMVDKFYKNNPNKMDEPVMAVIWDTVIKPNIKTGIDGKPLK